MTLRKREEPANCKKKRQIAVFGEMALEKPMDLSKVRLQNEIYDME
jgi:hypothetical protein